uniref:Uncharacterized protein n=1 Tax=Podoviridae sp. ctFbF42 TaxID=2825233 RepID=A0A8S5PXS6_9CAUD|nr:MAG TPA: hypothetical protein [Podoviridae sp. ctFbF42]
MGKAPKGIIFRGSMRRIFPACTISLVQICL